MTRIEQGDRSVAGPPRPLWRTLLQRWPSVLAVGAATAILGGDRTDDTVTALGELLPVLPLVYVVVVALQRRRSTWPVLVLGAATAVLLRSQNAVAPTTVLVALGAGVLAVRSLDSRFRNAGQFRLQAVGMLVFGAFAIAGVAVGPDLARYLVGAGWLLHGIWDFVHLYRDEVVARSYAECCGVLDVLVGLHLLVLA